MSLAINTNLMAMNAERNLGDAYGDLSDSTRKLSSGLRVDQAADDAAGLAVRELMRADIAAMDQGVRNANDGISAIQTADGALDVIDSKLIRMKELAEQAATGTYTADQREIIDQEYQQMKNEINRIANATEFNQVNLLDGSLSEQGSALYDEHDPAEIDPEGNPMKVHFGARDNFGEDYYHVEIDDATAAGLGIDNSYLRFTSEAPSERARDNLNHVYDELDGLDDGDEIENAEQLQDLLQQSYNHLQYASDELDTASGNLDDDWETVAGELQDEIYSGAADIQSALSEIEDGYYSGALSDAVSDAITHLNTALDDGVSGGDLEGQTLGDLDEQMTEHITTEYAQQALEDIDEAIEVKDRIRADLGAYQNRLENTVSNLEIQSENLSAAESQISDVDVAQEMTEFTRNQIKSQSATAMLAQANTLPEMAMQLMG